MAFHRTPPVKSPSGPGTPPIPGAPASPESPQVPEAPKSNFDIQKALDTAGFAEFVVKCSENAGITPGEESLEDLEKHFEIFEIKNKVASGIKKIYAGEIGAEIGVKIDAKELKAVDEEIERQALDNPEAIRDMWADIQDYDEMPKLIAEKQKELDNLAVSSGYVDATMALKQELGVIKEGKAGASLWGKTKMYAGAILGIGKTREKSADLWYATREIKQRGIPLTTDGIRDRLVEIEDEERKLENKLGVDKKAKQEEIDEITEDLVNVKKELFAYAGLREIVTDLARKKLTEQIWGKQGKGADVKGNDAAFLRLREFSGKKAPVTGLEYFTDSEDATLQNELDDSIQFRVSEQIGIALGKVKLGKASQYTQLEKELSSILEANTIGNMSPEDTRDFILKELDGALGILPSYAEKKQKAVLLAPIIQRLKDKKV